MVKLAIFSSIAASIAIVSAVPVNGTAATNSSSTSSGILAMKSPSFLPNFPARSTEPLSPVPTGPITSNTSLKVEDYPEPWAAPDVKHAEVQAAIKAIDWTHVPKFAPRTAGMTYDDNKDEACWWTNTQCTTPKVSYLPEDVKYCPEVSDFGLVSYIYIES